VTNLEEKALSEIVVGNPFEATIGGKYHGEFAAMRRSLPSVIGHHLLKDGEGRGL
jgi:hypothetical protein